LFDDSQADGERSGLLGKAETGIRLAGLAVCGESERKRKDWQQEQNSTQRLPPEFNADMR